MFIEQFELKTNSWYCKLMKYIWNLDHNDFSHICPFFWLTLLNLLIIIPFAIIKTVIKPIIKWSNDIDNKRYEKRNLKYQLFKEQRDIVLEQLRTDIELQKKYAVMYEKYADNRFAKHCLSDLDIDIIESLYYTSAVDRELYIPNNLLEEAESIRIVKEKAEKEKVLQNKQKINKIIKIFKPIAQLLLVCFTIFIIYLIYKLISFTSQYEFDIKKLKIIMLSFLYVALMIFAVGFILLLIIKIKIKKCNKLTKAIKYLFNEVGKIFQIIFQIIKNNCPAIKWD